jgi:biopolymer transport protein ExbB
MKKNLLKTTVLSLAAALALSAGNVVAQESKSLDELLRKVQAGFSADAKENAERERRFAADKSQQASLLAQARQQRAAEENRSAQLEKKFEENELLVVDKQRQLRERLGALVELFGHLTAAAGDLRSNLQTSITSAQFAGRTEFLDQLIAKMSSSEQLPSIAEIERLWFEMQREMTEQGRVVSFNREIVKSSGEKESRKVVRVGSFNLVSDEGLYLRYVPETGAVAELARQPDSRYRSWARDLAAATDGVHPFGADPTGPKGGSYLAALIESPTLEERIHQGGLVGYIIIALGVAGVLLALWRFVVLLSVGAKVSAQLKSPKASADNPLGRVLMVHEQNPSMDTETLELKLSEAVLKEVPKLEAWLNLLKIIATVAPLLGLLGTVTGMIVTFQQITIFGAGDPKAMAGGISTALVTTVLGLCVAIPMVLLHTIVSMRSKNIVNTLEERVTGIVAEHTEAQLGKN